MMWQFRIRPPAKARAHFRYRAVRMRVYPSGLHTLLGALGRKGAEPQPLGDGPGAEIQGLGDAICGPAVIHDATVEAVDLDRAGGFIAQDAGQLHLAFPGKPRRHYRACRVAARILGRPVDAIGSLAASRRGALAGVAARGFVGGLAARQPGVRFRTRAADSRHADEPRRGIRTKRDVQKDRGDDFGPGRQAPGPAPAGHR